MIRKRLSKRVPGGKRPWLIESDVVSHPLEPVAPLGVRTEPVATGTPGARRVTSSLPDRKRIAASRIAGRRTERCFRRDVSRARPATPEVIL
jgi:hypothetical protein